MTSKDSFLELSSPSGYTASSVQAGPCGPRGTGLFARRLIREGETIVAFGGTVIDRAAFLGLPPGSSRYGLQIDDELFIVSDRPGPADYVNHSCDPNAGLRGQLVLVAMRSIASGEEITYDYAMSDGSDYDRFECHCGSVRCRTSISGEDWRRRELWKRYSGFFSPYLQDRIEALRLQTRGGKQQAGPAR